jgi:hypothetical protein
MLPHRNLPSYFVATSVKKTNIFITLTWSVNVTQLFSSSLMLRKNKLACFTRYFFFQADL